MIFNPSSHGHFLEIRNIFGYWFYLFILGNIILVYRERKEFTISKVYQNDLIERRDVGDVSKFLNGETETAVNHWWPSVITTWQGTKSDINRLGQRRAPCYVGKNEVTLQNFWPWHSEEGEVPRGSKRHWPHPWWKAGAGGHDCPCCTPTSGSSWRDDYWGQTRKWIILHNLSFVLSHKHLLLETEDMLGGHFIFYTALHLLLSFVCHSPSLKGSSLKFEKVQWLFFVFLKET